MKERWAGLLVLGLFLSGCGPKDSHEASFTGTFRHTLENDIANTKDDYLITVAVDHSRFRLDTKAPGSDLLEVFDGHTLYRKTTNQTADNSGAPIDAEALAAPEQPVVSAKNITEDEADSLRFWANAYQPGHPGPGGLIAGRDTLLYRSSDHRPDGDMSMQEWVDAKTGVLLKNLLSIYSSQARTMVRQESWECQTIDYGSPDGAAFQKP